MEQPPAILDRKSTNLEGRRVNVVVMDDPEHADELALGADGARREPDDGQTAVLAVAVVGGRLGDAAVKAGG